MNNNDNDRNSNNYKNDHENQIQSSKTNHSTTNTIAVARWKLLRNAIVSSTTSTSTRKQSNNDNNEQCDDDDNNNNYNLKQYSIHRFEGYNLLPKSIEISTNHNHMEDIVNKNISFNNENSNYSTILYNNLKIINLDIVINDKQDRTSIIKTNNLDFRSEEDVRQQPGSDVTDLTLRHDDENDNKTNIDYSTSKQIRSKLLDEYESSLLALAALIGQEQRQTINIDNNEELDENNIITIQFQIDINCSYQRSQLSIINKTSRSNVIRDETEYSILFILLLELIQQQQESLTFVNELKCRCCPELIIHSIETHKQTNQHSTTGNTSFNTSIQFSKSTTYQDKFSIQRYVFNNQNNLDDVTCISSNDTTTIDTSTNIVKWYTRESQNSSSNNNNNKKTAKTTLSLQQLASHRYNDNIDNTGNICVWDCSKILTWILLHYEIPKFVEPPKLIIELGVGMAGLAGLSLYDYYYYNNKKRNDNYNTIVVDETDNLTSSTPRRYMTRIVLTDGHKDCVRNNRINIRLCQAANTAHDPMIIKNTTANVTTIECHLLKWSIPQQFDNTNDNEVTETSALHKNADLVIVADCIHFEEYHVALLWTIVQSTCIGGTVWLCQPNRGQSLSHFLLLIDRINNRNRIDVNMINVDDSNYNKDVYDDSDDTVLVPLLTVYERFYDEIEEKHSNFQLLENERKQQQQQQQQQHTDDKKRYISIYDANIHKPRVIVLQKNRNATKEDHSWFLSNQNK